MISHKLLFYMWNEKSPSLQPTIRTSQCQDGLKFYEWRCQGIKRRFKKPKHTKEHIKKDSLFILSKILNLS